jgi:hypothetical protein
VLIRDEGASDIATFPSRLINTAVLAISVLTLLACGIG